MAEIQYLNDLEDVSVPAPADDDFLYWDEAAGLWKSKQIAAGGGTVERSIRASSDDIYVYTNGTNWLAYTANERWHVGYWASTERNCGGGGRFLNIYIPKDATITHAYLKQTARSSDSSTGVKSRLHGEKAPNPATFSNYANYDARTRTDAVITWDDINPWTAGVQYSSPDIKTIIEEIVALPAWASGNPLVIFWDDHDYRSAHVANTVRRARSWNHASRTPPMLYIEWTA